MHFDGPPLDRRTLLGLLAMSSLGGCCGRLDPLTPSDDDAGSGPGDARDGDGAGGAPADPLPPFGLAPLPATAPTVRVRIARHDDDDTALEFGRAGETLTLATASGGAEVRVPGPVRIDVAPRTWNWSVADASDRGALPRDDDDLTIASATELVLHSGGEWPGRIHLSSPPGDPADPADPAQTTPRTSRIDVVVHADIERYVAGVIARELPLSWRPGIFAALSVCARSFATYEAWSRRTRRWDVESDERSQVFGGRTLAPVATDAVAATTGMVLTYADGILPAYFSSACGGLGQPGSVAIGPHPVNAIPPLAGHALGLDACCSGSPRARWTAERSSERLGNQLRAFGRRNRGSELADLGRIRAISPNRTAETGRPVAYRIDHVGGEPVVVPAPSLRRALQSGRRSGESAVWSSLLDVDIDPGSGRATIQGRGWGHGCGLCQYGGQAMARRGVDWTEILSVYYPGATIQRGWATADAPPPSTIG
ncbi:MAG: SpoIID/LytB domain-containing protein [Phycisphaerales bacterium]